MDLRNFIFKSFFVLLLGLAFVSCENEDNNEGVVPETQIESILLANGWKSDTSYDFLQWDDNLSIARYSTIIYFIGDGKGIFRFGSKEFDTEFGTSTSTKAEAFEYQISGGIITIDGKRFKLKNDALVSEQGDSEYRKIERDNAWIEKVKYTLLPTEDRFRFTIDRKAEVFASEIDDKIYFASITFSVKGSDKLHSRGFSYIKASYSIWKGSEKTRESAMMYIQADNDMQETHMIYADCPMEVLAEYEIYDTTTGLLEYVDFDNYSFSREQSSGGNSGQEPTEPGPVLSGSIGGHVWVDLGLPSGTKWATVNVGASEESGEGWLFAWGETAVKSTYTESNYKWKNLTVEELRAKGVCKESLLTSGYDAASVNWGVEWAMPNNRQWEELMTHCEWTSESVKLDSYDFGPSFGGIVSPCYWHGYRVTGKNGQSIYLPEVWMGKSDADGGSIAAHYWSANVGTDPDAWFVDCSDLKYFRCPRYLDMPVRAVVR